MTIVAILVGLWYVNNYILNGTDKQQIFIKTFCVILMAYAFSIISLKMTNPNAVNNENSSIMLKLISDATYLMIGYLFGIKNTK